MFCVIGCVLFFRVSLFCGSLRGEFHGLRTLQNHRILSRKRVHGSHQILKVSMIQIVSELHAGFSGRDKGEREDVLHRKTLE